MNPTPESESKTCGQCRHWERGLGSVGECHVSAPIPGNLNNWPTTTSDRSCWQFRALVEKVLVMSKVSDEQIVELVKTYCEPLKMPDTGEVRQVAYKRANLVEEMEGKFDISRTAAVKRIERLVSRGVLKQGENPYPNRSGAPTPGIYVWIGTEPVVEPALPEERLLSVMREACPNAQRAISLRAIHRELERAGVEVSLATVSRRMGELVDKGAAARSDDGFWVAGDKLEVEV